MLKLGNQEEEKNSEDRISFKVWKILTPEAKTVFRSGEDVNIGLVKDNDAKTGGHGGEIISQQHKNIRGKYL